MQKLFVILLIFTLFISSCNSGASPDVRTDLANSDPTALAPGTLLESALGIDWEPIPVLSSDPANDQTADGTDLGDLRAFYDDEYVYIHVEILEPGAITEYAIALFDTGERLFWIYYFPEEDRLELSMSRLGREDIEAEVYYGQNLELKLSMDLFATETALDQDLPIREVNIVRAMVSSLQAGDEVSGGIIPNQSGEFEYARYVHPYVYLQATVEAQYAASGASQYESLSPEERYAHEDALRFITYNIQYGGQEFKDSVSGSYEGSLVSFNENSTLESGRLPNITELITAYNPDLVALQELDNWDKGTPSIADQFSERTGMEYVYCTSAQSSGDTAIYSKHPIVQSETYPFVRRCFIHLAFLAPSGETIHVFANHARFDPELGCNAPVMQEMIDIAAPYMDGFAILMGDLNISNMVGYVDTAIPEDVCYEMLEQAGWIIATFDNIDQIYVSESLLNYAFSDIKNADAPPQNVPECEIGECSDHSPVIWDIYLQ
jgi:endonuclease/exonuclease/phosphatase family metal-dependent hydrolase